MEGERQEGRREGGKASIHCTWYAWNHNKSKLHFGNEESFIPIKLFCAQYAI